MSQNNTDSAMAKTNNKQQKPVHKTQLKKPKTEEKSTPPHTGVENINCQT